MKKKVKYISEKDFDNRWDTEEKCMWGVLNARVGTNRRCVNKFCEHGQIDFHYKKMSARQAFMCIMCKAHIYPLAGTIFHRSHRSIVEWFKVMFRLLSCRNGISSLEIARNFKIAYRPVLRMTHQMRNLMGDCLIHQFKNTVVEIDESYIPTGTKGLGRHHKFKRGRGSEKNDSTLTFRNRSTGQIFLFHIPNTDEETIIGLIEKWIKDKNTLIVTDSYASYNKLQARGYKHVRVNHKKEYKNGIACTNDGENVFSKFDRTVLGTYSKLTHDKLQNYCNEHAFRFSFRFDEDYGFEKLLQALPKYPRPDNDESESAVEAA